MGQQKVIVFCGAPCSGKSTLAEAYCAKTRIPLLQKDSVVARLFPSSSNDLYERQVAYRALHLAAEFVLDCGNSAIIDGVYRRRDPREELESIVAKTNSLLYIIVCRVTPEEAVRRFTRRPSGHAAVDLTAATVYQLALHYPSSDVGIEIDTARGIQECLSQVEQYLTSDSYIPSGVWTASGAPTGD
jgi:predicted kinase